MFLDFFGSKWFVEEGSVLNFGFGFYVRLFSVYFMLVECLVRISILGL